MTDDSETALVAFGASSETLTVDEVAALDRDGFLVIQPDWQWWRQTGIDLEEIRAIVARLVSEEGWRGGMEGKEGQLTAERPLDPGADRLGNLIDKHPLFRRFIGHPKVLAAAKHVIGAPFKCSAVDMRNPLRGAGEQHIHIDWLPRMRADEPYLNLVASFYLDDSVIANGALRIIPGTHRRLDWPNEHIDVLRRQADEQRVELGAGGIVIFNALTWHAGAVNEDGSLRRTIYVDYRRRDVPQLLNQKLYLRPETIADLSQAERYLLAVRDNDPTDETKTLGQGAAYRERYGAKYISIQKDS